MIMFILLLVATCLFGVQASESNLDQRIIGGDYANIFLAPHTVALLLDKESVGSFWPTCTGIVIGIRTILTAAQCTNGTYNSQWLVRAGTPYHNSGGQLIFAAYYVQHPNFNSNYDNDIAVIVLQQEFRLGAALAIGMLPYEGQMVPEGSIGVLSGFGPILENSVLGMHMYLVKIPIINQEACVATYASYNPVTDNMVCAGDLENGGVGPCQEDLGGPLVVDDVIVGITSWSLGCGRPKYPGVWTRVSKYRAWIDEIMLSV